MTAANLAIYENLSFSEYQRLPGHSYSSIKADGRDFEPSAKMRIGTQVHQYLLEPQHFTGDIALIKPLALALKSEIGDLWQYLKHEIAVTCEFHHEDFMLPYRGKIDSGIKKKIVIDYKIGEDVRKSMGWMGYQHQGSGYATAFEAPVCLLITVKPRYSKKPIIDIIPIGIDHTWWEEKILLLGNPVK